MRILICWTECQPDWEAWAAIGQAVGAIATAGAVWVALKTPVWQREAEFREAKEKTKREVMPQITAPYRQLASISVKLRMPAEDIGARLISRVGFLSNEDVAGIAWFRAFAPRFEGAACAAIATTIENVEAADRLSKNLAHRINQNPALAGGHAATFIRTAEKCADQIDKTLAVLSEYLPHNAQE